MTTLSHQPSLRLAPALPPTLQPHAVLSIAPPTDRRRSLAASAAIYAFMAGGVVWLTHVGPPVVELLPPIKGEVLLSDPGPIRPVQAQPQQPTSQKVPEIPLLTPRLLPDPTVNSLTPPVQPIGPMAPPVDPSTSLVGTGTGGGTLTLSGAAVHILHQVDPVYPFVAKAAHLQGRVVIHMTIDDHGLPVEVNAVSGPSVFQGPALEAARQWRFEPARMNGEAVPASFLLTLNFVLR